MATPGKTNSDIASLARGVDELAGIVERLREENNSLHNQMRILVAERASLIDKTEQARARIESMISRLRSMEQV